MTILNKKTIKEISLYCTLSQFLNFEFLYKNLQSICEKGVRYSIITRVVYKKSMDSELEDISTTDWKSLGEQIKFNYINDNTFKFNLENYIDIIVNRLSWTSEIYGYINNEILGIQILIYKLDYTEKVIEKQKFNTKSLGDHKELINVSKTIDALNKKIPLTMDFSDLGKPLNKEIIEGKIVNISLKNGEKIDFISKINIFSLKDKNLINSEKLNFYQKDDNIICVESIDENNNIIEIYNINGTLIHKMEDHKTGENNFTRKVGNVISYINERGIYNKDIEINFDPIYPSRLSGHLSKQKTHPDWRIGTLDLETYKYTDDIYKVYAIGFYADKKTKTYYINEDLNSDELIMKCLDDMLIEKYNRYTFYVHNFGGFDVVYILNILIKIKNLYPDVYDFDLILRDNVIISMNVSKKVNNKKYFIKFVDSYNILPSKLSKLCETFNTDVKKSYFPYSFATKQNLFYVGNKPAYEYYKNKNDSISKDEYNKIPNKNWSMKDVTLLYLKDDLESLFGVIRNFSNNIFINYHTHTTSILTISGLAMNIFLRKYYGKNIPLINKKSIYNDIKLSYFGGITEVYKPYGKNLYYYDVNSLYPYSALKPLPGLKCIYKSNINQNIEECFKDLFGFYECEIETSNGYLGLLPVRDNKGVYMPNGYIKGWFFSEELKFAYENGYKIRIIKGYQFDKAYNVFDKYIKEFYTLKSTTKDSIEKSIAKSLLNNLLGRFGMNIYKNITELVSEDELSELLQYTKVSNILHIGDKILVSRSSTISSEICDEYDVDYNKTYNNNMRLSVNNKQFKEENLHDVSIAISAAVTAYSRIYMNNIKLNILKNKGNIYYTDTDSIVTDIQLDSNIVGSDIGQFKLEHKILEGYFISNKTYCLKTESGKIITRTKGVNTPLYFDDFINLYNGKNVKTVRNETVRNFDIGSVKIDNPREISISSSSYTKRLKVFDKKNKWIDTKPITQNRTIHTYSKKLNKKIKRTMKYLILLLVMIIVFILIILYIQFNIEIPYEYIIEEISIEHISNKQTLNKPNFPKFCEIKMIKSPIFSEYTQVNNSEYYADLEMYLRKSKIIRMVILSHMDSIIDENNLYINQIKSLEMKNSDLNKFFSEIGDILSLKDVKNP